MSRERSVKAFASISLLSILGSSVLAARAQAPAPPNTAAYPPVEVSPPSRAVPPMTKDEQSKLKKDLSAARDRQTTNVKSKPVPHPEGTKP